MLNRSPSTISREIRRNSTSGKYSPQNADHKAYVRWKYRKTPSKKIRKNDELERFIRGRLELHWSPETIAGVWNKDNPGKTISHLTIYRYIQSKFGCGLWQYLYQKREIPKRRRPKPKKGMIPERVWVEKRPNEASERKRLGDYESDLIVSTKEDRTVLLTTVCRTTRLVMAKRLPNKRPTLVAKAMRELYLNKPLKTVTMDNGIEFKEHQQLGAPTYFCHPYSSWQKGSIEYANRLIRRYFPKRTRLADISQKQIDQVIHRINNTPKKCLNWETPAQAFARLLTNPS